MARIMKDYMLSNGVDFGKIKALFYESGDKCDASLASSREYIVASCNALKISVWDFVTIAMKDMDNDKDFSQYQKSMAQASLLIAWEQLEENEMDLVIQLRNNSK